MFIGTVYKAEKAQGMTSRMLTVITITEEVLYHNLITKDVVTSSFAYGVAFE